jgi:hypothetical protein
VPIPNAAYDRRAGQADALFGTDDVHEALRCAEQREIRHAEFGDIALQRLDLDAAVFLDNALPARRVGGNIVIDDGDGRIGSAHPATGEPKTLERLRGGHLMNEVAVDVEDACAVLQTLDHVAVPYFVEQRFRHFVPLIFSPSPCGTGSGGGGPHARSRRLTPPLPPPTRGGGVYTSDYSAAATGSAAVAAVAGVVSRARSAMRADLPLRPRR